MTTPNILDPKFRYISAKNTDLRKTFARIRREQKAAADSKSSESKPVNFGIRRVA